jgi:hypothetical protein
MKAPGGFTKCTICLSEEKLTFEHIIPESLGGFLEVDLQCAKCNNDTLGSKLIPKAKKIYPVRLAIRALRKKLPDLYKSIEEGQEYTAKSSDESISTAFFKKGEIVSKASKDDKGMVTVDKKDTEKNLRGILKKEGFSEADITNKLEEMKIHKIDEPLKLSNTLTIIKRKFIELFPKADDVDMDNRIVVLIAYNYLCITLGDPIFDTIFDSVRNFILKGVESQDVIVEQFPYNGPYQTYHKLYRENFDNFTKINIVLFGTIA